MPNVKLIRDDEDKPCFVVMVGDRHYGRIELQEDGTWTARNTIGFTNPGHSTSQNAAIYLVNNE